MNPPPSSSSSSSSSSSPTNMYQRFSSDVIKRGELISSIQNIDKNRDKIREERRGSESSAKASTSPVDTSKPLSFSGRFKTMVKDTSQAKSLAERSTQVRRYRASKMEDLVFGRTTIRELVKDTVMLDMRLIQILNALPRMDTTKSTLLLAESGINPKKRLRGITVEQFNDMAYVIQAKYPALKIYL